MHPFTSIRRVLAVLAAVAGIGLGLLATAPAASAHEPVATNYCTNAPDAIPGFYDFRHACAHHDACYSLNTDTRYGCDTTFRREMHSECAAQHPWWSPARPACRTVADAYYAAVRLFGASHYVSRDPNAPMH